MESIIVIESWWRHLGCYDRVQASGQKYDGKDVYPYLEITDNWWDTLTDDEKREVYEDFFSEV